jgi:NAD(P)-dependent dehydrogenase (short-subunit alcohol dehydrogenase family)
LRKQAAIVVGASRGLAAAVARALAPHTMITAADVAEAAGFAIRLSPAAVASEIVPRPTGAA